MFQVLGAGSSIDAQDDSAWRALHFADRDARLKTMEELLGRVASPNFLTERV